MKRIATLLISFTALGSFGQIKEIESIATIDNVIVYNSSAEIKYKKEINLPQGTTTLIFTDLTPFIVENTVNMSSSSSDVNILTVTEKINYIKERPENNTKINELNDSIIRITNDLGILNCKIEAMKIEKELLFKDESIGGVSKGVAVAEIEKASVFFNKRYTELSVELYLLGEKGKLYQRKLDNFKKHILELSKNTTLASSEIRVTVTNPSSKNVVFNFSFLTAKAGWAPIYDCKYQGSDKPIQFIFRANVFNATGISWENVNIKLSTASPTNGFNAPSLNSNDEARKMNKRNDVDGVQFREIQVANSIAEYDIQNKYSIPSDSKPYTIDVNSYEMAAEFNYLLIPKLDPYGFLMAKIPNWNKYNLIPGTTNVYNKGSFMGKTFLNTYAENDTLNLYLGKDNNILSTRKEVSSSSLNNVIGNYYVSGAEITITVKNSSTESLKIQVLDQVPVISDEKTKLKVDNISQAIYDKQEGLLTWNFQLAPNGSNVIEYKYEVKEPKNNVSSYKYKPVNFRTISCPSF